jgi:hypothetical protein
MTLRHRLKDESGYTLIELLLATAAGLLVSGAAFAVLITALTFSNADAQRVAADQQGSTAMETIVQALESSCVAGVNVSPIIGGTGITGSSATYIDGAGPYSLSTSGPYQITGGGSPSSGNTLTFVSSLGDSPTVNPNEIQIDLAGGALVENIYKPTTGATTWAFPTTPTSTATLIQHAAVSGSTTPLFSYYPYTTTTATLATSPDGTDSITGNLDESSAQSVAEVGINLQAQPDNGSHPAGSAVDVQDGVVLRLSAVSNEAGSTGFPNPQPCA